jgi:predicted tellurium resistance membrane protein TerC
VLRGIFIGGGLVLIDKFHALVVLFGGFLVYSSYQLLAGGDAEDEEDDLSENPVVKWATRTFNATDEFDGGRLFTRRGLGEPAADAGPLERLGRPTPLLLVLVCVELSDILFAVDSIPAVFGVTSDPFVAFSSNIFAIIGLRSLYSVLASAVQDLVRARRCTGVTRSWDAPIAWLHAGRGGCSRLGPCACQHGRHGMCSRAPCPALATCGHSHAPSPLPAQAYLEKSVAIVLGFVGVKLLAQAAEIEVGTGLSLAIVTSVLGVGVGLSLAEQGAELAGVVDGEVDGKPPVPSFVRAVRSINHGIESAWVSLTGGGGEEDSPSKLD